MDKEAWKAKIEAACEAAGTYRPYFESVIDTLAGVMEMRDDAQEKFEASGGSSVVKHTNKGGASNIVKNPALVVIMDCNAQALAYWRDLGLTPAGLKKIDEQALRKQKRSSMSDLLRQMDNGQ